MNIAVALAVLLLTGMLFSPGAFAQSTTVHESPPAPSASYDSLNALPDSERPVVVTASFELRDINYVDDEAETFEFTGVLKLSWHDPRQAFNPVAEGFPEKMYQGDFQFNEVFTGWFPQAVLLNESGMYDKHGVVLRVLPDGTLTLRENVNATAKTDLNLRRYPFDKQRLEAVFEVLGFDSKEVVLRTHTDAKDTLLNLAETFRMPQWHLTGVSTVIAERRIGVGQETASSIFVVRMDLQRRSFFILRLVVLPVMVMVMLSWSVFWMEKSSLGDRASISFIGILTVVAYQMVLGEILPRISYITLMNGFLNISFFIMCASVIINLRVSLLDRQGRHADADRLDHRCQWIFPVIYFGLILLAALIAFFLLPPA